MVGLQSSAVSKPQAGRGQTGLGGMGDRLHTRIMALQATVVTGKARRSPAVVVVISLVARPALEILTVEQMVVSLERVAVVVAIIQEVASPAEEAEKVGLGGAMES